MPPVAPSLGQCALPPESIRFMIVVDRSGSMRPHWSAVRAQLARLVDRVPHGSLLHVEVFDGALMDPPPVQLWLATEQARVTARERLARLPVPVRGGRTDLGRALIRAADIVQSQPVPATFVFWITDGRHEPDPQGDSPFRTPESPAFHTLAARWADIHKTAEWTLPSYVIPIGTDGESGAELIRRIMPWTEYPAGTVSAEEVGAAISRMLDDMQQIVIRNRVAPEIAHPRLSAEFVLLPQPAGLFRTRSAEVRIRSTARCISYQLTIGPDSLVGLTAAPLLIPPGDSVRIALDIPPRFSWGHFLPWQPALRDTVRWPLHTVVRFEPARELVASELHHGDTTVVLQATGIIEYERLPWWWAGVPVLLLGLAWWLTRKPAQIHWERTTKVANQSDPVVIRSRREYRIDTSAGGIRIDVRKASAWSSPSNVILTVTAETGVDAAIAVEGEDADYDVIPLQGEPHPMSQPGYILWRTSNMRPWPRSLSVHAAMMAYPGYEWKVG